jgi:hypothetical protein
MVKLKPEILTHPNIPKPLHGINPRSIMGKAWWDKTRKAAYKSTNFHCVACGVAKIDAKMFQWLEAHEYWNIDYQKGVCEVVSIEPLCHYCHNFIHSGRLSMIMGTEKTYEEVVDILKHGFKVLDFNKLDCFPDTFTFAQSLGVDTLGVKPYELKVNPNLKWSDWKLIFNGKEYRSNFDNIEQWHDFYTNL